MNRPEISDITLELTLGEVRQKAAYRLRQKGRGAYAGPHEAYGILAEEFYELLDAMHKNDAKQFRKELLDIAVGCVIGMASSLPSDTSAEART